MSMIADKIEKFILDRMREEQEKLILKRNELADELDCAPSQISYVLSTRFSNERGFDVESRRGLGGYIRIKKINPESSDSLPAVTTYRIYEGPNTVERLIDMRDVDQSLFQLFHHILILFSLLRFNHSILKIDSLLAYEKLLNKLNENNSNKDKYTILFLLVKKEVIKKFFRLIKTEL